MKPWTPLVEAAFPDDAPDQGPTFVNCLYQVTVRTLPQNVTWLVIRRHNNEPVHDWRDLQQIKNELCGPESEGVELYPAESRLVDESNEYHMFVLPPGERVPFGYGTRSIGTNPPGKNKQRPWRPGLVPAELKDAEK